MCVRRVLCATRLMTTICSNAGQTILFNTFFSLLLSLSYRIFLIHVVPFAVLCCFRFLPFSQTRELLSILWLAKSRFGRCADWIIISFDIWVIHLGLVASCISYNIIALSCLYRFFNTKRQLKIILLMQIGKQRAHFN